jgi:hypothetical protein
MVNCFLSLKMSERCGKLTIYNERVLGMCLMTFCWYVACGRVYMAAKTDKSES